MMKKKNKCPLKLRKYTQLLSVHGHLASLVTIVPTPRGVSSPAPLVLCPEGIIPRVGQTGIPITLITWSAFLLSLSLSLT